MDDNSSVNNHFDSTKKLPLFKHASNVNSTPDLKASPSLARNLKLSIASNKSSEKMMRPGGINEIDKKSSHFK